MKKWCFLILLFTACRADRKVNTSFYYWKTVYQQNATETDYLRRLQVNKLYIRITDVDVNENGQAAPVSPINFKDKLPENVAVVPVVFITNNVIKDTPPTAIAALAAHLVQFVNEKVHQAGKSTYHELQIDCDWTASSRNNYFNLLKAISRQASFKNKQLSVTLRLHQLRNLQTCGIPPVNRVMLMCYNMGNLRKYGQQNSILDLSELKKYADTKLATYPIKTDIALPLFSWAVAFRNKQYLGISKQITLDTLFNKRHFKRSGERFYQALDNLPQFGLLKNDVIRWEDVSAHDLMQTSKYLSGKLNTDTANITYFHLDQNLLKTYPHDRLEEITDLWL